MTEPEFDIRWASASKCLRAGGILTGESAAIYLADALGGYTHGNYSGWLLHDRSRLHDILEITVRQQEADDE